MPKDAGPIVVVGSINMDLVATTDRIPSAGETVMGSRFEMHPEGKARIRPLPLPDSGIRCK